jgi:hypothetical protein
MGDKCGMETGSVRGYHYFAFDGTGTGLLVEEFWWEE